MVAALKEQDLIGGESLLTLAVAALEIDLVELMLTNGVSLNGIGNANGNTNLGILLSVEEDAKNKKPENWTSMSPGVKKAAFAQIARSRIRLGELIDQAIEKSTDLQIIVGPEGKAQSAATELSEYQGFFGWKDMLLFLIATNSKRWEAITKKAIGEKVLYLI